MGLLDAIARSLAHVSDAQRSYATFRPVAEDPTAALSEAIARRRRQRVGVEEGAIGPSLLDGLVLDPTIRVRYTEKASLVEVVEEDIVDIVGGGAPSFVPNTSVSGIRREGGGGTAASEASPMVGAQEEEGEAEEETDGRGRHRPSRLLRAADLSGVGIGNGPNALMADVKEMFAVTRRTNPSGVRFVGDRVGWDRCLADMAAEQRMRDLFGDDYADAHFSPRGGVGSDGGDPLSLSSSYSSADGEGGDSGEGGQQRSRRRRGRMNASLQRRLASVMVPRDELLAADEEEGGSDASSRRRRSRRSHHHRRQRRQRPDGPIHYDSDDDDARSVYYAMEQSTAYNSLGRPPRAPPPTRRTATHSDNADDGDENGYHSDSGDALYEAKVRKLKAPRLAPKVFTHVHRCVGTDDTAAMMAEGAGAFGGHTAARSSGAASGGHYSYRGAGKAAAESSGGADPAAPFAIAGRRFTFMFATLSLASFCLTALLWAYVSYLRYLLSGDVRFTTGGRYWHDGYPLQTFEVNASNGYAITSVKNDTSWVWVGDELYRVKPGGLAEIFGVGADSGDKGLTLPMLGTAFIACVVAGLVFCFLAAAYIVCYVNGTARRGVVADVVRMKRVSDLLRATEKEAAEAARGETAHISIAAGENERRRGGDGSGGSSSDSDSAGAFGYDYSFEAPERRSAQLRSQRRREARVAEQRAEEARAANEQRQRAMLSSMSAMMAGMGLRVAVPDTLPPAWAPAVPTDRAVEFNDSIDPRVEGRYGWLRPLLLLPIPLADVLLADPSRERRKAKALLVAVFAPAWVLALIPTIVLFLVAGDAMDTYFISYVARTMGGIDLGVVAALLGVALFVLLPLYYMYHRKAGRFIERRYG